MCPPSSELTLFARSTVATAFHRISERIGRSSARSPGYRGSRLGTMVFRYGVFAEYGTGTPMRRASVNSSATRNPGRSAPSNSVTEPSASIHSRVSPVSRSSCSDMVPLLLCALRPRAVKRAGRHQPHSARAPRRTARGTRRLPNPRVPAAAVSRPPRAGRARARTWRPRRRLLAPALRAGPGVV